MTEANRPTNLEVTFTAGPWKVDGLTVESVRHGNICLVNLAREKPETEANLRLIAAAPELLALAKQYASECAECNGSGITDTFEDNVPGDIRKGVHRARMDCPECEDIRAVIAKAEGRT